MSPSIITLTSTLNGEDHPSPAVDTSTSVLFVTVQCGVLTREAGGIREEIGPGQSVIMARPGETYRTDWSGPERRMRSVRLDPDVLSDVASASAGGRQVEFTGVRPVSREAERQWQQTVAHVARTLESPGVELSPFVVGESSRFLAAMSLTTFPNTTFPNTRPPGAEASQPVAQDLPLTAETVREAVAFIEGNAADDLSLADIAEAAGVTARAIQLGFRRHLDTTPMAYLRTVRLARIHDELVVAVPGDGVTVTEVASRWGFSGSSRFVAHYREVYGVVPSDTLAG